MPHVDDGQLNALLDNELDAAEQADVQSHLASCAQCRARLDEARAFLVESGALLELLGGTQAGGTGAQGHKSTELPKTPAKTAQEPALNIDGRTAKTIASPFFPQAAERIAEQAAKEQPPVVVTTVRRFSDAQLAWAATIILAIGVGFLSNEVLDLRRERALAGASQVAAETDRAIAPDTARPAEVAQGLRDDQASQVARSSRQPRATAPAPATAPARREVGSAGGGTTTAPPRSPQPAPATVIPPIQRRADKPPEASGDLAGVSSEPSARDAAGPSAAAPSTQLGRAAAPSAPAPGAAMEERSDPSALSVRNRGVLDARVRPNTFRPISGDSAIRTLSGSIRLVDGLRPRRIEIGPGTLVPGADTGRDVVRVHYVDSLGRSLVLDQQPGDTPATTVNGLMPGDTLVTTSGDNVRLRWLDRKNFWLSLSGPLTADELRAVVTRIR